MYETRFTFLCTEEEKSHLRKLAVYHRRSQSDVIRELLRKAIGDLSKKSITETITEKGKTYDQPITKA